MPSKPVELPATFGTPPPKAKPFMSGRIIMIVLYLFYAALFIRTLAWFAGELRVGDKFPWVIGIELLYLALFTFWLWRPGTSQWISHLYFLIQCSLLVSLVILVPGMDFSPGLFFLLSYQVALAFRGKTRIAWVAVVVVLTVAPLMLFLDPLRNLALGLSNMAGVLVLAAYIAAAQTEEAIRAANQAMLAELQETHRRLEEYSSQVEELTAIEERNRLARELHDSVSQTMFSIILNVRATLVLMQRDPARLRAQLETLQRLAQSALAEMRGLIAQLRPKTE